MRKIVKDIKRLSRPCSDCMDYEQGERIGLLLFNVCLTLNKPRGLAHNQIGGTKKVFIAKLNTWKVFINPQILELSPDTYEALEFCFSTDEGHIVNRHHFIKIKYLIKEGLWKEETFVGDEAQTIQHEMDHLNGVTIKGEVI